MPSADQHSRDASEPVKYAVFSHYSTDESADFEAFKNRKPESGWPGFQKLVSRLDYLKLLLESSGLEGMLVLFYAPGYQYFLKSLAHADDSSAWKTDADVEESGKLTFAAEFQGKVMRELACRSLTYRIRFLIASDLGVILGRVNAPAAEQFFNFFVGALAGIRYDAPKVLEAIVRLRLLGGGIPVFRADQDVLFPDQTGGVDDTDLFRPLTGVRNAYLLRLEDKTVSTFLFSAGYNSAPLLKTLSNSGQEKAEANGGDAFEAWGRAFATRIYPALRVDAKALVERIDGESKEAKRKRWNQYVHKNLDNDLARRFYGVRETPEGLKVHGIEGLTAIGAHPLEAVISGALLCLSDGAILDLPPFSNFGTNVMWIDDHLKYALHRAMKHFTHDETQKTVGPKLPRLERVAVTKARPGVDDLPRYILGNYLPTVLWGTVMDAWITTDPILKCRYEFLNEGEKARWKTASEREGEAPLPAAMAKALSRGYFADEQSLKKKLKETAIARIEEVRRQWSRLTTTDENAVDSFASLWADGRVEEVLGPTAGDLFDPKNDLWKGLKLPGLPLAAPITKVGDLSPAVVEGLDDLISYAISYVRWTIEWPRFVQIVRSVAHGRVISDLGWVPPAPVPVP